MRSGRRRDEKKEDDEQKDKYDKEGKDDHEQQEGEDEEEKKVEKFSNKNQPELATISMQIDRDLKIKGIVNVGVDDQIIIKVDAPDKEEEKKSIDWKVGSLKLLLGSLPKNA